MVVICNALDKKFAAAIFRRVFFFFFPISSWASCCWTTVAACCMPSKGGRRTTRTVRVKLYWFLGASSSLLEPVERSLRVPLRLFLMVRTMQARSKQWCCRPHGVCLQDLFCRHFTDYPRCSSYCTMEHLNPTTLFKRCRWWCAVDYTAFGCTLWSSAFILLSLGYPLRGGLSIVGGIAAIMTLK